MEALKAEVEKAKSAADARTAELQVGASHLLQGSPLYRVVDPLL